VAFPGGVTTSCVDEGALPGRVVNWARRLPILDASCQSCEAIGICGGGCIFDGEAIYGPGQFDQRNCHFTKTAVKFMIWDIRDELAKERMTSRRWRNAYACSSEARPGHAIFGGA